MKSVVAAALVSAAGVAGLVIAWLPQSEPGNAASTVTVSSAYVRPPAAPNTTAAVYLSIANGTSIPQRLASVRADFAGSATVHAADMTESELVIPAHTTRALSPGSGHVMVGQLYAPLVPGRRVHLVLTFVPAGPVQVTATVVALTDPVPSISGAGQ